MASSACCVHQISGPVSGKAFFSSVATRTPWLRLPRLGVANAGGARRRVSTCLSAVARTIAATPDSEVGASSDEEEATENAEAQGLEDEKQVEEAEEKPKIRKTKSLVHILEALHQQAIEVATKDREIPDIRPGCVVQIRIEAPETKRRVSLLRGIVICKRNSGVNTTFTIRRIIAGVGVEMVIPLYSPNIKEITVLKKKKVRRAKLYYLRHKLAKFSTF